MNDVDVEQFASHRPFMLSVAYRMLGSRTEAEEECNRLDDYASTA